MATKSATGSRRARRYTGTSATRGVHHLALTTEDMKATTEFYVRVVGMPLVHAMKVPAGLGTGPGNRGNPTYERIRHYFFDMGNDSLLAFFEIPARAEPAAKRDAIGGMQHCAFAVTPRNLTRLRRRLQAHRVPYSGPTGILPGLKSIYFFDPNGVRLEACCQPGARDKPTVVRSILQSKPEATIELETLEGVDARWLREMSAALPKS